MQCPVCKIEAAITGSRYVIKNDTTKDAETELYIKQDMKCRNPNCPNYNKIIDSVKNQLPISKDSMET